MRQWRHLHLLRRTRDVQSQYRTVEPRFAYVQPEQDIGSVEPIWTLDISDFDICIYNTGDLPDDGRIPGARETTSNPSAFTKKSHVRSKSETVKLVWFVRRTWKPRPPCAGIGLLPVRSVTNVTSGRIFKYIEVTVTRMTGIDFTAGKFLQPLSPRRPP